MRVVLTTEALSDIESIGDYISQDSPARAQSFVAELLHKTSGLAELPYRFALMPRYADLGIRRCVHGSYLIFYRIDTEQITVIHILHGSRDYDTILFP